LLTAKSPSERSSGTVISAALAAADVVVVLLSDVVMLLSLLRRRVVAKVTGRPSRITGRKAEEVFVESKNEEKITIATRITILEFLGIARINQQ